MSNMMVFSGNANLPLAEKVSHYLGLPLGKATVGTFSDGETMVEILENVRGRDVFIIQPTCAPTNDHLMELIIMADALRRASANRITAVVPYFGYARQDRRVRSARVPITAKIVADMMVKVRISRLLTIDLHADQVTYTDNRGKTYQADSAEILLKQNTGWQIPVNNLRYWIRALPAPHMRSEKVYNSQHQLISLQQQGWKIDYLRYQGHLPSLIQLTRPEINLRIVINQFQYFN